MCVRASTMGEGGGGAGSLTQVDMSCHLVERGWGAAAVPVEGGTGKGNV